MGFKNSVSLAQHVHRCIVGRALRHLPFKGEAELRKDRTFTTSNPCFRIYLDKFDELCKVSKKVADAIEGKVSPLWQDLVKSIWIWGYGCVPRRELPHDDVPKFKGRWWMVKLDWPFPNRKRPSSIHSWAFSC